MPQAREPARTLPDYRPRSWRAISPQRRTGDSRRSDAVRAPSAPPAGAVPDLRRPAGDRAPARRSRPSARGSRRTPAAAPRVVQVRDAGELMLALLALLRTCSAVLLRAGELLEIPRAAAVPIHAALEFVGALLRRLPASCSAAECCFAASARSAAALWLACRISVVHGSVASTSTPTPNRSCTWRLTTGAAAAASPSWGAQVWATSTTRATCCELTLPRLSGRWTVASSARATSRCATSRCAGLRPRRVPSG